MAYVRLGLWQFNLAVVATKHFVSFRRSVFNVSNDEGAVLFQTLAS